MGLPKHVIAATALVRNEAGQILLILSPRRGWEPPGGIIEEGEDVLTGLQREILEETGVNAKIGTLFGLYTGLTPPVKLILAFQATYISGELTTSPESLEVGWYTTDEALIKVTHPAQKQRLEDGLQNQALLYRVYHMSPYEMRQVNAI